MSYEIIKPETIYSSMMNNRDMVGQFVEMYLLQSPLDFEKLADSIGQKDIVKIGDAAHHIKPTMEYIGATTLRLDFQELEDIARKHGDLDLITERFVAIKTQFDKLMTELRVFLEEVYQ